MFFVAGLPYFPQHNWKCDSCALILRNREKISGGCSRGIFNLHELKSEQNIYILEIAVTKHVINREQQRRWVNGVDYIRRLDLDNRHCRQVSFLTKLAGLINHSAHHKITENQYND